MLDFLTGGVGLTVIIVIVALVLIMALVLSTWRKIPNDHAAVNRWCRKAKGSDWRRYNGNSAVAAHGYDYT